jgi:hypothetical protein
LLPSFISCLGVRLPESSGGNSLLYGNASGRSVGKCISAGLDGVTVVSSDPSPTNRSWCAECEEFAPQFLVLQLKATAVAPAKPLPTKNQKPHSVDQQLRVRAKFDLRAGWRKA